MMLRALKPVSNIREYFLCLDYRSLGLLRILLGLLLLHSWFERFADLQVFYSPHGILPPWAVADLDPGNKLYFTDWFKSTAQIEVFFYVGLVFYFAFTLGFKTRFSHICSILFYIVQTSQCAILKSGGQRALGIFLLWSLFLPMSRRFSLDCRFHSKPEQVLCAPSLAAFFVVFQIALIYFLSAFSKLGPSWLEGTAVYYTLESDSIIKPLGVFFREHLAYLEKPLDYCTLVLEWAAAPCILSPFFQPRLRHLIVLCLVLFHLGIWLTINVCDFSLVMISSYVLLLRPDDWQEIENLFLHVTRVLGNSSSAYERSTGSAATEVEQAAPNLSCPGWRTKVANASAVFLLFLTLTDAAYFSLGAETDSTSFVIPPWISRTCQYLSIGQDWRLFAPDANPEDGWYVVVGFTRSGEVIDPLTGKLPNPAKSDTANREMYKTCNWRKYTHYLHRPVMQKAARAFCHYLKRRSRRKDKPGDRLVGIKLYYISELTPPPGTPRPFPTQVELIYCDPPKTVERLYPPLDDRIDEQERDSAQDES
jgi:hypothetical protein